MSEIRRVLVATDFSSAARSAQQIAMELAQRSGASVTLLHVYSVPSYLFFDGSSYVPAASLVAEVIADVVHGLEEAKRMASSSSVQIETAMVQGSPEEQIISFAEGNGFDLIALGTHGRHGMKRLLLGSVAEHVVRLSRIPVLTVHGED